MSKSLARVIKALRASGLACDPVEMTEATRTADQAAAAVGCVLDQIVKSILFQGQTSAGLYLFLTAGGNQVDQARASALAQEVLGRADASTVRAVTGFAIGGVAPIGHLTALPVWIDPRLAQFDTVWAAAGTPRHVFAISPGDLARITGAGYAEFAADPI